MAIYLEPDLFNRETSAVNSRTSFDPSDPYATRPQHMVSGITTTPRLTPINESAFASALAPTTSDPHTTIANLRFPADLVHTQAAAYADGARAKGAPHSMQLWRDGCREALIRLARTATNTPTQAACDALFWQLEGDEYYVSVTFGHARSASHTRPIH
ncbi:MAG: hypothetical protein ABI068_09865 [Ktedonobacterales bacterium]